MSENLPESKNSSSLSKSNFSGSLKDTIFENDRQERLSCLMKETQDWFSKVKDDNSKWKSGLPNSGGNKTPQENIQSFFHRAEQNFNKGNSDLFSSFVQENQEKFAHLLKDSMLGTAILKEFPNRPSNLFSNGKNISKCEKPSSSKCFENNISERFGARSANGELGFTQIGSRCTSLQSSQSFCSGMQAFQNKCSSTSIIKKNSLSQQNSPDFTEFLSSEDISSPSFEVASPTNVRISSMSSAYQLSSRRTFEYCGSTNTFKFSSEQVTQTYEQGYESISESEDDDDESEDLTCKICEPSECDDTSIADTNSISDHSGILAIEYDLKKDKLQQTLHKIATELLTTERTYVAILHMLDQVFAFRVDQENRAHVMFPQEVVSQMFTNLKSLYKLHHDFLLPQLEERMKNWEMEKRIGDIMKNFAPFLKMYTEYVKNYDNSMNLITIWYQKQPRFAQIMDEIHNMKECDQLTVQHHMLTPVQRVPRYQLLLKDYLKKLPEDSPDKLDTEKAFELVSTAARHANETMKKIDKFKKLLEIQEMIGGAIDLVSPSRELLKEGKIIKISARSGDHQERYLFLFNDLLLLCSQRSIANKVVSGPSLSIRARLDVYGLVVEKGDNLETANTFYVRNSGRSIELYTPTLDEKVKWMEALAKAVHDWTLKKSSLKAVEPGTRSPDSLELGKKAPQYVKVEQIACCMACNSQFSTFKRKHHCHACGIVACNKCLSHKVQLSYEGSKQGRVCNQCYEILIKNSERQECENSRKSKDCQPRNKGILDVMSTDPAVVSGYLQLKARSRFWVRRWFALHEDFVLYSFNSHLDDMALTSMPLPGYTVALPEKNDTVDGRENVFKLYHKKKVYFFQTVNDVERERWVVSLEKASRAETSS